MRVAVTGAAGFIGSHLCERLLAAGQDVVALDGFTPFYARELKESNVAALRSAPRCRVVERNLLHTPAPVAQEPAAVAAERLRRAPQPSALQAATLAEELDGVEAVVHLAGRPGVRGGSEEVFERGNVGTTEAVIEAAALAGVRRLVLASSSSVYGPATEPVREDAPLRPLSRYGRSKARAERAAVRLCAGHGIELVTLRYFTVYGPRQRPDMAFARYLASARAGELMPLLGDGSQLRDFTYVGDAVEGTLLALERGRPRAVYNIAGGRPTAVADAFALLAELAGAAAPLEQQPPDAREPLLTAADLSAAERELGYRPATTLEQGLAAQARAAAPALARA